MNCPRCGRPITKRRKRCEVCGQDISMFEHLVRHSNTFYNRGLERARVRDLSGAVVMLKKSLEINKENTDARNLLGLVYFELGEVVAALGEWVISKHFQPENNDADYFMDKVQSDSVAFDNMNQTIKKYNLALANAKQGSDDLAVLQLKRVISMNPRFVQALLLLALLYMRNCEYEKAKRCLARVQKIDVANVTALRYQEEIRLHTQTAGNNTAIKDTDDLPTNMSIVPVSSYKEDKPNFMAFVTFFLGILIGVAVIYYMAVPNIRRGIMEEYNRKERDYSTALSASEATIDSLRSDITILETKIDDLERTLRREDGYVLTDYEPLILVLYKYREYIVQENKTAEQAGALVEELEQVDMSAVDYEPAIELYETVMADMEARAAEPYAAKGMELYAAGEYEAALTEFEQAYRYNKNDPEILYHLARIYHRSGRSEEARSMYQLLISEHKSSARYQEAVTYLEQLGEAAPTEVPTGIPAE
ncbi:MAG: tetratricopeptide repeat protein [Lachnospiraceae bacterium]